MGIYTTKWNSNGAEKKITMQVLVVGVVVDVEKVASPLMRNRFDCVELLLFYPIRYDTIYTNMHVYIYIGWVWFVLIHSKRVKWICYFHSLTHSFTCLYCCRCRRRRHFCCCCLRSIFHSLHISRIRCTVQLRLVCWFVFIRVFVCVRVCDVLVCICGIFFYTHTHEYTQASKKTPARAPAWKHKMQHQQLIGKNR